VNVRLLGEVIVVMPPAMGVDDLRTIGRATEEEIRWL
jgi:hypothetical protein